MSTLARMTRHNTFLFFFNVSVSRLQSNIDLEKADFNYQTLLLHGCIGFSLVNITVKTFLIRVTFMFT